MILLEIRSGPAADFKRRDSFIIFRFGERSDEKVGVYVEKVKFIR